MMPPPVVERARDVAALRTYLLDQLRPRGLLGQSLLRVQEHAHASGFHSPTDRRAEERVMAEADLYYLPCDALDAMEEAMSSVPDDVTLTPWQLPSESGFAVFERTVMGLDAMNSEGTVRVDGLAWGPVRIWDEDEQRTALCLGITTWVGRAEFWVPLGRSDWEIGTNVIDYPPVYERMGPSMKASASEDRRMAAAMWALALATPPDIEHAPRHEARRAQRAGITRPAIVRVITFPKSKATHSVEGTGRHVGVRFMVRGHWRNQACGPKRKDHRHVYIAAHWRGPEDAPLSNPATVVKRLKG